MPDSRRHGTSLAASRSAEQAGLDASDRDRQIDALLVQGLDLYFAGSCADAIHVWTRVLFLDRTHPRARAYIDRARTTLAERQRQTDELVQTSQRMLERGETRAARDLLTQAVAVSGEDDRAAAVRAQLERVERARGTDEGGLAAHEVVPGWTWHRRSPRLVLAAIGSLVAACVLAGIAVSGLKDWVGSASADDRLAAPPAAERLPVPSSADVALIRARTFYGHGRLAEALKALDSVSDRSPARDEADKLRIEIQRLLIATQRAGRPSGGRAQ
jgi:hypothetical protein